MDTIENLTEEHRRDLRILAARLVFRSVATENVVELADRLLCAGVYDDALLRIVDAQPRTQGEVIPPFLQFLKRVGISVPSREKAMWILLSHHMHRIAETPDDPLDAVTALIHELYYDYGFDEQPGNNLGQSHGIHRLLGDYWLHEPLDCHAEEFLKSAIRRHARDWIRDWDERSH